MFSRLKQLFRRNDAEPEKREVHERERTDAELRAEAQHAAHGQGVAGGHVGMPGGGGS
jgi:hypothetical protein